MKKEVKSNRPTIAGLAESDPAAIARYGAEELAMLWEDIAAAAANLKIASARLLAGCAYRYHDDLAAERKSKPFGVVHMDDEGFDVSVDQPKTIKWDSEKLGELIAESRLTAEQADHYIRYKYDVLESRYSAAPPNIRKLLGGARTVSPGTMKFSFVKKGSGR